MTHFFGAASLAAVAGNPWALVLAFAVGLVSSLGPCTPSRLLWLSAMVSRTESPWRYITAFVLGSVVLYASFAAVGSMVQSLFGALPWLYAILGVVSLWLGLREVWNANDMDCHVHADKTKSTSLSLGTAFLQGVLFAAMIQPCCTPLVLTIATTVAPSAPLFGAAVLAAFGLGHGAPAYLVGPFARMRERLVLSGRGSVVGMVMGGIGIAVGGYFLVLA